MTPIDSTLPVPASHPSLRRRTSLGVKVVNLGLNSSVDPPVGESSHSPILSALSSLGNTPLGSPRDDEMSESEARSKLNTITSKNLITRWAFPLFQDQLSFKRYKRAQKKDYQWKVILPPFLIMYTISVVSRSSLDRIGQGNIYLTLAHNAFYLCTAMVFSFIGCHVISYYHNVRGYFKMCIHYCEYFLQDSFFCRVEDMIGILGMLSAVFFLLSRVTEGACPISVSASNFWINLWESQRCNPVAHSKSIPQDQVTT